MAFPLDAAIVSLVRTPVGRALKGTLRSTRPDDLGAAVVLEAIARVKGLKAEDVEDVVLGCAMPEAEQGLNLARNIVLLAGLPHTVCGETINRFCSSGLQAIAHAALAVQTGLEHVVVAGGVESMSMVPMGGNKVSLNPKLVDRFPERYIAMGHTAERVSERFGVTRADQDAFAVRSHERAIAAIAAGRFKDETLTVKARLFEGGKASEIEFSIDECPRPGTTTDVLGKLKPVFKAGGTVTAGNSSPHERRSSRSGRRFEPEARQSWASSRSRRLRGYAVAGVDPDIMGIGPVPAIRKLLAQTGLGI